MWRGLSILLRYFIIRIVFDTIRVIVLQSSVFFRNPIGEIEKTWLYLLIVN